MELFFAKRLTIDPLFADVTCLIDSSLRVLRHGLVLLDELFDFAVPADEEDFERTASSCIFMVLYVINYGEVLLFGEVASCDRVPPI